MGTQSRYPPGNPRHRQGYVTVIKVCPVCSREFVVDMPVEKYDRWQAGEHIQDVFWEMTPMQRESMISGVCSDACWDRVTLSSE
jgi:hypothetical protein